MRLGQVCRRLADIPAAEAALREAIAVEERLTGADNLKLGPILNELGVLLAHAGRLDEALACYRRTHDLHVAHGGEGDGDAAIVLANMANLELRARHYRAACDLFERALPVLERHHGEDDPRVATFSAAWPWPTAGSASSSAHWSCTDAISTCRRARSAPTTPMSVWSWSTWHARWRRSDASPRRCRTRHGRPRSCSNGCRPSIPTASSPPPPGPGC